MLSVAAAVVLCLVSGEVGAEDAIKLRKCCGVNQALNGDATACVPARWPQYYTHLHRRFGLIGRSSLHESWLRRWVPPGVPLGAIEKVFTNSMASRSETALRVPVRTSGLEEGAKGDDWRRDHVLFSDGLVYRRSPEGGFRRADYCVDAALEPFPAPFALLLETLCDGHDDCVKTCCPSGQALKEAVDGSWLCARNRSLSQSSVAALRRAFDPEVPTILGLWPMLLARDWLTCPNRRNSTHLLSTDASARALIRRYTDGFFSRTLSCVSYIVRASGSVELVALHCDIQRWSRTVYWCTRPLSFASVLLLLAAEASILSSPRMRSSVHGWALGCHAGCLLAFNFLQLAFFLSVSDDTDSGKIQSRSTIRTCTAFALLIYFFLTSASCWLTGMCLNINAGFKETRVTRSGRRKRRFLMLSTFAWGIPAALTFVCAYIRVMKIGKELYRPSLMETRTCFHEAQISLYMNNWKMFGIPKMSVKWGSALYYYAPMAVLSAVNATCIIRTALRVRFLSRGNSVLRRETREHYKNGEEEEETSISLPKIGKARRVRSPSGPKSVSVYIKLLLSTGFLELTAETTAWACSRYVSRSIIFAYNIQLIDHTFSYRAVGYLTDLARAAIVLWLAAPDVGDLHAFCRRLRRSCRGLLLLE